MSKVRVRVWQGTIDKQPAAVQASAVMDAVVRIWGQAGVEITREALPRTVALAEVKPGTTKTDAETRIANELAPTINDAIRTQGGDPHLDVVLLPLFSDWGKAYTPLTPAGGNTVPSFAPFLGPVAIATTGATIESDRSLLHRGAQAWPVGEGIEPQVNPLIAVATANDLAHEMGHLFGLWHTTAANRPGRATIGGVPRQFQFLIHETIYNRPAKFFNTQAGRDRTEEEVRTMLIGNGPGANAVPLGRDTEWFVALRGEQVHPDDILLVQENIDTNRYLTGN